MKYQKYKKYLPVAAVALLLVTINVFAVLWYVLPNGPDQWGSEVIPGKVVELTATSITTKTPRGEQNTFQIKSQTQFFMGRNSVGPSVVKKGMLVLVEVDESNTNELIATEVRIMTDKREGKTDSNN
jgi:hypothetical protein